MSSPGRPRIATLPERVKNQIAAGEVVERPASVVKELVENAIDAGATRVEVDLEEGGSRLVRVRDDGHGIAREDLALAFAPHATSKLEDVGDLEHIASLGFRGEALASIGAVARCRIVSRERGTKDAFEVEDEGCAISPVREAGGAEGTLVEVRELFFNVPARRRFLKTPRAELARCLDVLQRIALAQPGIGVVATHDGARVYDVERSMDLAARIRRTFGAELAAALEPVAEREAGIALAGFVAPPRFARSDASRQMWFLNGRIVRDKLLVRALKEAYRGLLFDTKQPVAFLALSLDPARVDVNVHPAKAEVRFRDERSVFGVVASRVRAAALRTDMATPGARMVEGALRREQASAQRSFADVAPARAPAGEPRGAWPSAAPPLAGSRPADALVRAASDASRREEPASLVHERPSTGAARDGLAALPTSTFLQVAETYLVRALEDGFEIVDQHALHERITFEELAADLRAGAIETQRWLVPELVEASRAEVQLVGAALDALARIGIELAVFGPTTLAVHGLPARLARPDPQGIVRDVIAVLEAAREPRAEDVLEAVLHRAACRSSVMAGDRLTQEEMRALFERGAALESDQTCVHGRPTRVRFTLDDLERAFARR